MGVAAGASAEAAAPAGAGSVVSPARRRNGFGFVLVVVVSVMGMFAVQHPAEAAPAYSSGSRQRPDGLYELYDSSDTPPVSPVDNGPYGLGGTQENVKCNVTIYNDGQAGIGQGGYPLEHYDGPQFGVGDIYDGETVKNKLHDQWQAVPSSSGQALDLRFQCYADINGADWVPVYINAPFNNANMASGHRNSHCVRTRYWQANDGCESSWLRDAIGTGTAPETEWVDFSTEDRSTYRFDINSWFLTTYDAGKYNATNCNNGSVVTNLFVFNADCDDLRMTWDGLMRGSTGATRWTAIWKNTQSGQTTQTWLDVESIIIGGTSDLAFPNEYPSGAEPPEEDPPASYVPRVACGHSLRDMGAGRFFADVEAVVMDGQAGAVDSDGGWYVSWDAEAFYPGRRATIPLPLDALERDRGELQIMYSMTRYVEGNGTFSVGWTPEMDGTGAWVDIGPDWGPWGDGEFDFSRDIMGEGWVWLGDALIGGATGGGSPGNYQGGPDNGRGFYVFDQNGDGDGEYLTLGATKYDVQSVKSGCGQEVDPVTYGGPSVIVVPLPPHPTDPSPDDGVVPYPPGTEDGDEKCGSIWTWNPFDALGSIFCRLGGLLDIGDGIADLLGWFLDLGDWLGDMFIPDLGAVQDSLGEIQIATEARVPFTWFGEVQDAFDGSAWTAAGAGACEGDLGWSESGTAGIPEGEWDQWACAFQGTRASEISRNLFTVVIWGAVFGRMWTSAPWNRGKDGGGPA